MGRVGRAGGGTWSAEGLGGGHTCVGDPPFLLFFCFCLAAFVLIPLFCLRRAPHSFCILLLCARAALAMAAPVAIVFFSLFSCLLLRGSGY